LHDVVNTQPLSASELDAAFEWLANVRNGVASEMCNGTMGQFADDNASGRLLTNE
jgi:hypothetical protein